MPIHYLRFPQLSTQQRNQLFAKYADHAGAFLLDSSSNKDDNLEVHENARYDILAVKPIVTINCKNINTDDPLAVLKQHLPKQPMTKIPDEIAYLPCIGGLFFALSYDLGKYYENISHQAKDDLQLADMFAGIFGCILIIDRKLDVSFLICTDEMSMNLYEELRENINKVLLHDKPYEQTFCLLSHWKSNFSKADYFHAFQQVQSYIQAGDCYQINLAQRFVAQCRGSSWKAYCELSKANNAPFSAFINTGEADILSLSPERFIRLSGTMVETRPIKGTRPRGKTQQQDQQLQSQLLSSKKDQAENLMIVDLMRSDLGRSCIPGSIEVPELFKLESFHSVHHLVSTIKGKLEANEDAFTLLANCFPGGSITGTPKIRAMNIIDQLEPHNRSYYCGSIGYIDIRGNMDTSISIRTLVRKEDQLYCWAGGGLVSGSDQHEEYQETFDKVSCILPVLEQLKN